jgi:hypothetical protein
MVQIIALVVALISPIVPAVIMARTGHGWYYLLVWVLFYPIFGFCEFLSIKNRKRSISKDIAATPPLLFWSIVLSWEFLTVGLAVHWYMMR